ncbi:ribonuclease P protein component [Patescibacteria group bacterium]|nr:ribonuclease P protein component [Patescibacteria group bacterium]
MALPAEKRLKLARDFRAVSRSQRSVKEGKLLFKAKASQKNLSRFGIVVSKSVAKKAVDRNRLRRLLSEALRAQQDSFKSPYDIVLVALPGFSLKDLHEAQSIIEKLFLKAKLTRIS